MKFKNQIFAILAVLCVILSVCAVSAVDDVNSSATDGDNYDPGVPSHADGTDPTADDETGGDNYDPGIPEHGDGTDPTETTADNAAGGAKAATTNSMPATGNPILVLMAIGAVLGGATLMNRKK